MARARQQCRAQRNDCPPGSPGVQDPAYRPVSLFLFRILVCVFCFLPASPISPMPVPTAVSAALDPVRNTGPHGHILQRLFLPRGPSADKGLADTSPIS